jgi:hypothetical protein
VELPRPHIHLLLGVVAPLLQPPQHLGQVVCLALLQSVYRIFLIFFVTRKTTIDTFDHD